LAPSDFYLFGYLKRRLVKCHGTTKEEFLRNVSEFLHSISEEEFGMTIDELLAGEPTFPDVKQREIACKIVINDEQPIILEFVLPSTRNLIPHC
jgi:hypothetical protein